MHDIKEFQKILSSVENPNEKVTIHLTFPFCRNYTSRQFLKSEIDKTFERQCCPHPWSLLSIMAAFTFLPHKPKKSKLKYPKEVKHGSQSYVVLGEGEEHKRSGSGIRG